MTVVYTAARYCELCGGLRDRGSRLEHEGHVGGRYVARPCPHAEGDRHRRQVILTREARAGWILSAGRWWTTGTAPRWALGRWVDDWYHGQVRLGGQCPWLRDLPRVPGGSLESSWLQLDGAEENLGAMREWAVNYDAEWSRARSADGRAYDLSSRHHTDRAELVAKLVAAGRQVERTGVPWWRVVRELELVPYLPAWIAS